MYNVVSMAIRFGENQGFWYFKFPIFCNAIRKNIWQAFFECLNYFANLAGVDNIFVELIGFVFVIII